MSVRLTAARKHSKYCACHVIQLRNRSLAGRFTSIRVPIELRSGGGSGAVAQNSAQAPVSGNCWKDQDMRAVHLAK